VPWAAGGDVVRLTVRESGYCGSEALARNDRGLLARSEPPAKLCPATARVLLKQLVGATVHEYHRRLAAQETPWLKELSVDFETVRCAKHDRHWIDKG
jgi:hypothetical protein